MEQHPNLISIKAQPSKTLIEKESLKEILAFQTTALKILRQSLFVGRHMSPFLSSSHNPFHSRDELRIHPILIQFPPEVLELILSFLLKDTKTPEGQDTQNME